MHWPDSSCDYWGFSASYPCVSVGGGCGQGASCGLFYFYYSSTTGKGASLGSRFFSKEG